MHYRLATPADVERVAALHIRSWQETYRGIMPDSFLDHAVQAERLAHWQAFFRENAPDRQLLLAEADGQLAGFACTLADSDLVFGALLDNLHVAADFKGQGIGRQLMKRAAEWVGQQRPESTFYLWVYEKNHSARQFYENLGARNHEAIQGEYAVLLRYVWSTTQALIAACSEPVH